MKRTPTWLVVIGVAIPLLIAGVVILVVVTIPPAPDPATLPSRVFEDPPPAYRETVDAGRRIARELVAEEKLPGLSLAVAVHDTIVWAEGFRWADMDAEIPVTPATRFRIGGVSQSITAAAVGVLCERTGLDLDAPVQRYVPDFPEKEWPITTRQLMSHTSGLRSHRGEGGIFRGGPCADDPARLALFAQDPLRFRPGTQVAYSTNGWILVGAVVAAVANEPYLDFVQREVFTPLGMESTVADVTGQDTTACAHFYYPRMMLDPGLGLQPSPSVDLSCYLPAVGFLSTPSDLVRLGSALLGGKLFGPATAEQLLTPVTLASGESSGQALGWTVLDVPLGAASTETRIVGQGLGAVVLRRSLSATSIGGQIAGGTTALLLVPEHHLVIAVATNVSGSENVSQLATRLAELFVE